jgi:hypothetical protein
VRTAREVATPKVASDCSTCTQLADWRASPPLEPVCRRLALLGPFTRGSGHDSSPCSSAAEVTTTRSSRVVTFSIGDAFAFVEDRTLRRPDLWNRFQCDFWNCSTPPARRAWPGLAWLGRPSHAHFLPSPRCASGAATRAPSIRMLTQGRARGGVSLSAVGVSHLCLALRTRRRELSRTVRLRTGQPSVCGVWRSVLSSGCEF